MPKSRGPGFGRHFVSFMSDVDMSSLAKGLQRTLGKASAPSKFKPTISPQKMFGLESAEVFSRPCPRRSGVFHCEEETH